MNNLPILRRLLAEANATSAVLYRRDEDFPPYYQLIGSEGLAFPGLIGNFHRPQTPVWTELRLPGRDIDLEFFPSAPSKLTRGWSASPIEDLLRRRLFDSFTTREGIESSVRVLIPTRDAHTIAGVLWLNFTTGQAFDSSQMAMLTKVLTDCTSSLHELLNTQRLTGDIHASAIGVPQSITGLSTGELTVNEFCIEVLEQLSNTISFDLTIGFMKFYMYGPQVHSLAESAHVGYKITDNGVLHSEELRGVIGWAASQGIPILVEDIPQSIFSSSGIYVSICPLSTGQLAVPVIAGGELHGVLSVEYWEQTIDLSAERLVIAFCNLVGSMIHMVMKQVWSDSLLEAAHSVVVRPQEQHSLNFLSTFATSQLNGNSCVIWSWNRERSKFIQAGSFRKSPALDATRPRELIGWTDWIRRNQKIVWITDIRSAGEFTWQVYEEAGGTWGGHSDQAVPGTINAELLTFTNLAELGIPIMVGETCLGVAWMEFSHPHNSPPSHSLMKRLMSFVRQVGLVLEISASQEEGAERLLLRDVQRRVRDAVLKDFTRSIGRFDICVIHRSTSGDLGGDYYSVQEAGESKLWCFLGDGEGHGLHGSISMLPILGAIELLDSQRLAPGHLLDRLNDMCVRWKIHGTATTFVLYATEEKVVLRAASAGYPQLLHFSAARGTNSDVLADRHNQGLLGISHDTMFEECVKLLDTDDLLIAFTDGVEDTLSNSDRDHSPRRLIADVVNSRLDFSAQEIAAEVLALVKRHESQDFHDDVTIMVVKVMSTEAEGGLGMNRPGIARDAIG